MFSSTLHYRWHIQHFPQDLNRFLPFNPLHCFTIHFETILTQFLCVSGFWSISGLLFMPLWWILHWQTARSKCLNEGMLILSDLELHTLLYVATVTAISWLPEYRLPYSSKFWWGEIFQILTANTWWKIFWWIVTVFYRAPVNGVLFLNNLMG